MTSTPSSSQVPGSQASAAVAAATNTTEENVVHISDGEEQAAGPGKKRKQYSKVWNDFTQVCVDGKWKAKCKHCGKNLSAVSRNDDGDRANSFWSCLEDIQEEMKADSCITSADSD
ncbi:uncharacterized protein LOC120681310 [Panicum virgatum]|uniref:uncharacterized protein LOC120681310 n=1 Tax=Panicum virgatum TaxID=38727 RepID=UPI0019D55516|nr:uncharacterized protein LOC120681310 [Panicum virgatum]